MKLFCFPHAGGGGAMFNGWNRALGPRVEVFAVDIIAALRPLLSTSAVGGAKC